MSVKSEKYSSKKAMKKHEKSEGKSEQMMEYGKMKHPGFAAVQKKIAKKQGVSAKAAGAILASGARKASKKAVAANPRLKRVTGVKKGK
jgi:hypothetical protein